MDIFSNNLKYLRRSLGKKQPEIAEKLNFTGASRLSNWENGTAKPAYEQLLLLSEFYKVNLNDLVYKELWSPNNLNIVNEPLTEYTKSTDKDLLIASLQKNITLLESCTLMLEEKLRISEAALKEAENKLLDQQAEISELQNRKEAG